MASVTPNASPDILANRLVSIIESEVDAVRNQSLDEICAGSNFEELMADTDALDQYWRQTENLYHRVRALFFLAAIHRYHLPNFFDHQASAKIPFGSYQHLLGRRFVEAIDSLLDYSDPAGSEARFRAALDSADDGQRLELLTQIARTYSCAGSLMRRIVFWMRWRRIRPKFPLAL